MTQVQYVTLPAPIADQLYKNFSLISKTPQPQVVGFTITGYNNILINGNYAYAVGGGNPGLTLSIFDIRDQGVPKAIGYLTTGSVPWVSGPPYYLNGSYSCDINYPYLYVASSGSSYLYIVNVSNPFAPFNVGRLLITNSPGSIYGVSYQAGYCYLATQNMGLTVVNVTNPALPVQTFQEGPVKSFGVKADGNYVYTTQYITSSPFVTRQFKSWALTGAGSPSAPSLVQSLQVTTQGEPLGITIQHNTISNPPTHTAFVTVEATGVNSIDLIDIANPAAMTNLSQINSSNSFNSAFTAAPAGTLLYVPSGHNATYGGAIDTYDISNRSSPVHISQVTTGVPNSVFGNIALANGYTYCADYGPVNTQGNLDIFTQPNTGVIGVV